MAGGIRAGRGLRKIAFYGAEIVLGIYFRGVAIARLDEGW
jgi:hypothetical protein